MYLHPELADAWAALPTRPENLYADIEVTRANFTALLVSRTPKDDPRLTIAHTSITGNDGNEITVQILRPTRVQGALPCVLYIHGGGFAYGRSVGPSPMARDVCAEVGAVVVNVHYRLAPEHRFPAGVENCYAALCWIAENSAKLNIDPQRIAVAGASAGGNLSAALSLLARDRNGPKIAFQCLLIPLLDDQPDAGSMKRNTDLRVTNGAGIAHTWNNYLGRNRGQDVSPYAMPARAPDLSGLPPAYVLTCGLDPLRDQGLDYVRRLMEADVPVEVKDVPGAWHLFEVFAPDTELARRTTAHWHAALRTALHH